MQKIISYTLGKNGCVTPEEKIEGDNSTPLGVYPLREVWYRTDRVKRPISGLPIREILEDDCWCDDPTHPLYNTHFKLDNHPPASFEHLWREDSAYDLIVVIGYNDDPVIPGKGSAIFMHCMHDDGRPTAGCVAMEKEDLLVLISELNTNSSIHIEKESINII